MMMMMMMLLLLLVVIMCRLYPDMYVLYMLLSRTGDHRHQLFVVQSGLPQQSQLFHDATDRGTVFARSPCRRYHSSVMDYQTTTKGGPNYLPITPKQRTETLR